MDEELYVVELLTLLAATGYGITISDFRIIVDEIVHFNEPTISRVAVTEKVVRGIMERYDHLHTIYSDSVDKQRAEKATIDTRDAVFTKLEAQVQNLNKCGKIPWKNYNSIPSGNIYNMDEVGVDTTKHRNKIVSSKQFKSRAFTVTKEGDNKMNMHITCCLTSRGDGMFFYRLCFILGFFIWLIVAYLLSCNCCRVFIIF